MSSMPCQFATTNGLLVAIRGGGHHAGGHALCDDSLIIGLSGMQSVINLY
jgi:FAD/FMN-containing dehydrogenase